MTPLKLPHDAWVLVADGRKALFLRNKGDEAHPNLEVIGKEKHENPATREQGTDRPGRYPDAGGPARSAVGETDWHQLEEDRFAKELAVMLYQAAHAGRFQSLVIAAPARTLGELRKELHKEVAARVLAEIHKDLTNHPVGDIEKALTA